MTYATLGKLKKNSPEATLTAGIDDTTGTIPVDHLEYFHDEDGTLIVKGIVLGPDTSTITETEEITITGASGTTGAGNLTGGTRGVNADGTVGAAKAWDSGTVIKVTYTTGIHNQIADNFAAHQTILTTMPNRNAIINGDCRVNQRVTAYTLVKDAYTWDSDDLTGPDRHEGMATGTAVSAGTWEQTLTATAGYSGSAFTFKGVTLTGTGILYHRYRMEAKDAARFKNQVASFSCSVHHDVGSAINYTVYVRKANAADNFSAVTAISNSGAISVPSATKTLIKYENISMGDCSNGIEIEIKIECGAVTTKNFEQTELQFEIGSVATAFEFRHYNHELALCQRYCFTPAHAASGFVSLYPYNQRYFTNTILANIILPVVMRTDPTFFSTSPAWVAASPSGNKCAAYNITGGAFVVATGAVQLALNSAQSNAIQIKFTAATSFDGTSGDVCNVILGSSAVCGVSAEL